MNKQIKSSLLVCLGNLLYTIAVCYFVLPQNILSGGVAGIALILEALFGFNTIFCIDILIAITFILSYVFLGKECTLKTALSSVVYPIFLTILQMLPYKIDADPLLLAIFGGAIAGIGLAIIIRENACSGGTDVFALILNKYTKIPISTCLNIFDGLITFFGIVTYGAQEVMTGLIFIFVCNFVLDKIVTPDTDSAVQLIIVSEKKDVICDYIHDVLSRGTTILKGEGGYTNEEKEVILTIVSKIQYKQLSEEINSIDKYAFVVVSDAKEIKGEGFTYEYRV